MKRQVSPVAVVFIVVLTFAAVLAAYWRGLLGGQKAGPVNMMGGGGPGMPPPPIVGLETVVVETILGPLPRTEAMMEAGYKDACGAAARLDGPCALTIGPDGRVYFADARNHRVRVLLADGSVQTVAGCGPVATVRGSYADGPAAMARLCNPSSLVFGRDGALYVADTGNHRIRKVVAGRVSTVAGGETPPDRLGLPDGAFADGPGTVARFRYPTGLAATSDGMLLVVDTGNRRLRRVAADGTTTTVADLGQAGAQSPCGIAALPDGRTLITDPATEAIFVVTGGQVSRLPGIVKDDPIWVRPTGIAAGVDGTIYITDTGSHAVLCLTPGGAPAVYAGVVALPTPTPGFEDGTGDKARFSAPCAVAVASDGVVYVADFGNNCLRRIRRGR